MFKDIKKKVIISVSCALAAAVLVVAGLYISKDKVIYSQKYVTLSNMEYKDGVFIEGACQNVRSSVKVTENSVELTIGHDKMSGIPIGISPNNNLFVRFNDKPTVIITRVVPFGYEDTKDNEILVVTSPGACLLLSTKSDCEEIAAVMEEIRQGM